MKFLPQDIPGVVLIEPQVFGDDRGFFMETWHKQKFSAAELDVEFVQDNHSSSRQGTLRGLHFQFSRPQGKLIRVLRGEIWDVCVDLRKSSPTFGKWWGHKLTEANRMQAYLPPGVAHGFCVLSEMAEVTYKCTDFYLPADERTLLWNDPALGIPWPVTNPILSPKDQQGKPLSELVCYE